MSSTTPLRGSAMRKLFLNAMLTAALVLGLSVGSPSGGGPAASTTTVEAESRAPVSITATPVAVTYTLRMEALRIAASKKGDPYRWGAAGPYAFDCSGLVYYVYRTRLHRWIPRTANDQRLASIRLTHTQKRPGDLIFFMSGGRAYHVGIYAGYGRIWHAPRPGQVVQLSRIWTSAYVVGRVR